MKKLLLLFLFFIGTTVYAAPVLDLALCLDSSGSVSNSDFQLQLDGTAASIENTAITPHNGSVRITVLQFGTIVTTEVSPTVITAANAASVAAAIRAIVKGGGSTNMSGCITAATSEIMGALPASTRQVIDLSTDGLPNNSAATVTAAANSSAAGIDSLNALLVGAGVNPTFMNGLVFPQPEGGNNGFATVIPDFHAYAASIKTKIQTEITVLTSNSASIPTLSEWGLMFLAFSLFMVSWLNTRGRAK